MKGSRFKLNQNHAPIHEALETFRRMRVVPFDVPGHKRGRGNPELTEFLGQKCVGVDVNSMKPLDNLCHPVSVIREAEELAADAFGAAHAFLMVGGTTSSVQTMVLTACKRGDEIILPRNVHRSVLNALVLCGAIPVYVNPEVDQRLGISLGMKREQVEKAIKEHPKAVAVLVNNPTYYGICSDLRAIVKMAHDAGMLCLADEAHGTHFYFGGGLPVSAMAAGADMAAVSMHKSGGSLTQSSLLLTGPDVHAGYVRQIINLTQTTSASYLLLSSLDISRRNLALRGEEAFEKVMDYIKAVRTMRTEMNVHPAKKTSMIIETADAAPFQKAQVYLAKFAFATDVTFTEKYEGSTDGMVQVSTHAARGFIPMMELIDRDKELARLNKEKAKAEKELAMFENQLANPKFVERAPAALVEEIRAKRTNSQSKLANIEQSIKALG